MARLGYRIIDSDIHVHEPVDLWAKYLDPDYRDRAPKIVRDDRVARERLTVLGLAIPAFSDLPERERTLQVANAKRDKRYRLLGRADSEKAAPTKATSPDATITAMDTEGVDVAVVFRTNGAHVIANDDVEPTLAAAYSRAYNDWLTDFCAYDRVRLKPAAIVAMHDVQLAMTEARRAVEEKGAIALVLPNNPVKKRPWYSEEYYPFWEVAEALDVPVCFHGIQMAYQEHLARRYMDNFALAHACAHPIEQMLALGAMLTGGIFERFPGLRAAFLEGHCSWVPWWLYCLDEHVEKFGDDERFGLKLSPSEYFKRQCFVSMEPDEATVIQAIQIIGDDNIVISTDWPHDDSSYPRCIESFLSIDRLPEESRRKILWDNCARLYKIA